MPVRALGAAACRSYLIEDPRARAGFLVDPLLDDAEDLARLVEGEGLRIAAVVDTHTHADHLSAGHVLSARLGAPYAVHGATTAAGVGERLADGQVLAAGDLRVEVIHTPGHTGDSVTLRCDRDLLTGDFLFLAQDGAGRLDLPGGDAGAHWDSLQRLASLGDDFRVLPGHDYAGLTESTLGEERRRNPRFQRVTREEYRAWQRAVAAPTPDWMLDAPRPAVDCPTGGGACATAAAGRVPLVSPRDAFGRLRAGGPGKPFFLDVRDPWEHSGPRGLHAEGVVLVPLASLPASLDRVAGGPEREVLVICKTGGRSARAAEFLIEKGWRRVFSVDGGTERWAAEGLPTSSEA
jgi:glyoxylase-like metal-dependent hydrolase (beta-lactamase superfamily II)/rhodanese-related sulfurtransferase